MKKFRVLISVFLVCLISVLLFCTVRFSRNQKYDDSIHLAMQYLSNNIDENGRFVYLASVEPGRNFSNKKYNSLRHAGTLYSMYLCERYLKDNSLKEKRYLASEYFQKRYIKPVDEDKFAVVSLPEDFDSNVLEAKTGGSGLALAALSNLYSEDKIDQKTLQGLGNFILFMQKKDGSFYSKYDFASKTKDDKFKSLYYPGEAALGLLYLNEVLPSEKWVESAKNALLYLAKSRENEKNVPFDHWAALATKKLFETPHNGLTKNEKKMLQTHSDQLAGTVVLRQIMDRKNRFYGTFGGEMQLCSIATIMEGLSALYYTVDDKNLKNRIKLSLDAGNGFVAFYQVKEGEMAGGVPYSPYWHSRFSPDKYKNVRIDYVQHALSAWILYSVLR